MVIRYLILSMLSYYYCVSFVFFFKDTATTQIYTYGPTLSLHDALPILFSACAVRGFCQFSAFHLPPANIRKQNKRKHQTTRSEEHTSELQSLMRSSYAVFCLKKKKEIH